MENGKWFYLVSLSEEADYEDEWEDICIGIYENKRDACIEAAKHFGGDIPVFCSKYFIPTKYIPSGNVEALTEHLDCSTFFWEDKDGGIECAIDPDEVLDENDIAWYLSHPFCINLGY